ncbi:thioredoxin family protein [Epilithonimonas ginsengisoli]|uniref:Thioredoxin family protein n=1 Tax=Epilithonimonas ginsengisoli TaxID=1245592 RepID=A0ABU4JMG4_9FLAO|nr:MULTISPECIES: thioredoxin family protein [Chryseobacterium group]MBV6881861.1 thioredoxin family protein [Epilithonimonas sp. FP105]MDW8550887.1 thioredoxin family protein [Epilithonimonas ginsengisoli]OAH69398.1 alkyl hydroperoxide reductase [Chryseobacterium sp. FP211-J200]
MKRILIYLLVMVFQFGFSQEVPKVLKTKFSKEALAQKLQDKDGKEISINQILKQHKGKVVILDFWAGWCRDCLKAFPKAKELEEKNPNVNFVFLSLERSKDGFLKSLEKHEMTDKENYWFSSGWKNDFNNYIDLNWIPRYIVVDQRADIAKYYAITPDDPEIQNTIDKLLK